MAKLWEIREDYEPNESYRHGGKSKSYEDAFEEGYECGFGDAMRKVEEEKYGSRMGYRSDRSYPRMNMRDEMEEDDRMGERRRRRSNGRYY